MFSLDNRESLEKSVEGGLDAAMGRLRRVNYDGVKSVTGPWSMDGEELFATKFALNAQVSQAQLAVLCDRIRGKVVADVEALIRGISSGQIELNPDPASTYLRRSEDGVSLLRVPLVRPVELTRLQSMAASVLGITPAASHVLQAYGQVNTSSENIADWWVRILDEKLLRS